MITPKPGSTRGVGDTVGDLDAVWEAVGEDGGVVPSDPLSLESPVPPVLSPPIPLVPVPRVPFSRPGAVVGVGVGVGVVAGVGVGVDVAVGVGVGVGVGVDGDPAHDNGS